MYMPTVFAAGLPGPRNALVHLSMWLMASKMAPLALADCDVVQAISHSNAPLQALVRSSQNTADDGGEPLRPACGNTCGVPGTTQPDVCGRDGTRCLSHVWFALCGLWSTQRWKLPLWA